MGGTESLVSDDGLCTLLDYVGKGGANVGDDLVVLFSHLQYASKRIAALVASPFNSSLASFRVFPVAILGILAEINTTHLISWRCVQNIDICYSPYS